MFKYVLKHIKKELKKWEGKKTTSIFENTNWLTRLVFQFCFLILWLYRLI